MNIKEKEFLNILPQKIKDKILEFSYLKDLEEVRIRAECPVILILKDKNIKLNINATSDDILFILNKATSGSLYAYLDDIKMGFITIKGGHRIGICGTAVTEKDAIINIKDIMFLNIRMAREIIGVCNIVIKEIYDNKLFNTLIISPPETGKTTLLRDISRYIAKNTNERVVIIDERYEIASTYNGIPQNDIGETSFVMSGYPKKEGFNHAIRALSPTVIICDEIFKNEDIECINNAVQRGVKIIATMHGEKIEDIKDNKIINFFERIIVMDKREEGRIKKVYKK